MNNVSNIFNKYKGSYLTETVEQDLIYEIGNMIEDTINYHIATGDINNRFKDEFRKFLTSILNFKIRR